MFNNPFSPVFGGRPGIFFGRDELRKRFKIALADPSSEDRALFVTGTRGSGKTTLVELYSRMASTAGWKTIDLGPEHVVQSLLRGLVGYDEKTTTISPQVSLSILGSGGSVGGISTSEATHLDEADLSAVFLAACREHPKGVFVSIDEVQKVPESEVSMVCNAFQLAIRKGLNAILVVAGLPHAHGEIIRYEGCTFMRRASHVELTLLSNAEAHDALSNALEKRTGGLGVASEDLDRLVQASYGHPYVLQLLGYYLVTVVNRGEPKRKHEATRKEVDEAIELAISAYETRALQPLIAELSTDSLRYLKAMANSLGPDRTVQTSEVAKALGLEVGKAGYLRRGLLADGIVISAGYGKLMFNVPYLAAYVQHGAGPSTELERVMEWGL